MFLTDEKLQRRVKEVKEYRYRDILPMSDMLVCEDLEKAVNPQVPVQFDGWEKINTGYRWSGRDKYLWIHKEIQLPEDWKEKRILGIFDFGNTGGGNNSGFESLCFIDQKPFQGVDTNHKEVFFPRELCGKSSSLTFRLWSGLEGGGIPTIQEHRINRADLAWLDEEVDDFYYMGTMLLETIACLEEHDPVRFELRTVLDEACLCIDWSCPGSEEFYASLHRADELLNEKIDGMEKHSLVNVHCVGHTHIDMAWLWRLKHTHEKASRSFSTVLRLMELFPEYEFLQTQPQIYEYIKEDFPQIYKEIKARIQEGRWEADGAMWVEADCNLTSGESLTRQILIGSRFFKEEFGKTPQYLWLPDVFGYSWALPQILKKSGIDMFMTTKISWNQFNRMPHDTFQWKGMDGSEVTAHFVTTPEPWNGPDSWRYTYNGLLEPLTVKGVWDAYQDKEINKDLMISFGYGDGGGGVNRDMLEQRRRLDRLPGLPHVKTSTAGEYFQKLKANLEDTSRYVHTWDGELYLEYHRGTYTSQGYNKRMNRKMELLYRRAEWLTVMQGLLQQDLEKAEQEELTKGWKLLLTNQFHDIIPGSSIHEVYEDCHEDYAKIEGIAKKVESDFVQIGMVEKEHAWTVWNGSSWIRDELVWITCEQEGYFTDEDGQRLFAQQEDQAYYVLVEQVPQMGYKTVIFHPEQKKEEASAFGVRGKELETPFYLLSLNDNGQIVRLYDKEYEREVLAEGQQGNVFQVFEDKPLDFDAWDIDIFYQQKMREITELTAFEVKEQGALKLTVHLVWKYRNTTISQDMCLYRDSRRIDFVTEVDFHERQQLLKASFPVDIRSTYATYDIQYGNVRRPNNWNTSWNQACFESVAHRFADLSERNYGVSLLNDCKYGYDIKENVMRISLLRSGLEPDHLQDQGLHTFTYSLYPHAGDFVEGQTVQEAYSLNDPMKVTKGTAKLPFNSFVTFDSTMVELDAVKKSEDGVYLVVRFHEFAGSTQTITVNPGFEYSGWMEGNLMERPVEEMHAGEIRLKIQPYEIKTLLFML